VGVLVIAAGEGGGGRVGTIVLLTLDDDSEVCFLVEAVMLVRVVKLNGSLLEELELKGAVLGAPKAVVDGALKAPAPLKLLPKGSLL